ncbi:ATPase [Ruegeria sp. ANG-R]|uniref:ExeA family protein n=1 Tax=Ruegeria sp. ANG-R TaxID=1577903 RepID=UPI00057E1117|nr:AAA family ATPase [Ruegeria sp. ANG-R]KIC41657.1 ATPase [Ruegeria sp. ANG-R]
MRSDLYLEHFGFSERPFTLLPDPDLMFWSRGHKRAYAVLEYGLSTRAPLTVVTGEVGTGKTTLLQALLADMDDDAVVGLISNVQGGRGDLLRWVLNAFDLSIPPDADYVSMFQQFVDFVLEAYADNRFVVLVIDEAQNLQPETLEELRMLTNVNSNKDELLQLVLLGQPELRDMIGRPEMRQFAQRVSVSYHLRPMNRETAGDYVRFRLRCVGGSGDEINGPAIDLVHEISGGVPRVINKVCDLALVYAASMEIQSVDAEIIEELMEDGIIFLSNTASDPLVLSDNYTVCSPEAAE